MTPARAALSAQRVRPRAGFSLLEVMVAIAILSVALTAIFSSEAGAVKTAQRAHRMTAAALLARCKMAELEETVARDGLPAVESSGTDACCEGAEFETPAGKDVFSCAWKIERVELPDPDLDGEGTDGASTDGAPPGTPPIQFPSVEDGDAVPELGSLLGGGGSGDVVAEMALSYAYPILKPVIEEQVRRATVTVAWHEGEAVRSFNVVQFLVADAPPVTTGTGEEL